MRIIKQGNASPDKLHVLDCYQVKGGCGARFEAKTSEGRRITDPRDGDYIEWKCPCCSRPVTAAVSAGYQGPGS